MNAQPILIATLVFLLASATLLLLLRRRPPRRSYGQVACLPIVVGCVLFCMLSFLIPMTLINNDQIAFAESAAPIQAVTPDLIGQKVLAEGTISPQNPVNAQGSVAFQYYTRHNKRYQLTSKWTPPLLIELPGGAARIENAASPADANYDLENMLVPSGKWQPRLSNMAGGDQVVVIGRVVSGPRGAYLDAWKIFRGDRAAYIADRGRNTLPIPAIIGLAVFGGLACVYGLLPVALRRAIRRG